MTPDTVSPIRTLSIVVPVYRESATVEPFVQELNETLANLMDWDCRVIFVVDPSNDETENILVSETQKNSKLTVIVMSRRFGHQACLMEGLAFCSDSEAVITMDGDSQHPSSLIPELLRVYSLGFDVVNTTRVSDSKSMPTKFRASLGAIFYKGINRFSDTPVPIESADFRLISGRVARTMLEFKEQDVFVRGLVGWLGFKQASVNYTAPPRSGGESKYNLRKSFSFALRSILSQTNAPLKLVWLLLGLALFSTASLGIWTLFQYFSGVNLPDGWTTVILLILSTFSVQLLVLGIQSSYLGLIVKQVKGRPRTVIDHVHGNNRNFFRE
jgi:polyisoprenyl-phosphate glycosyltransferase